MHRADLVVLVAYFASMIAIGMVYSRQMHSIEAYFAGGKQLSWWIGGISFAMSYVSALSIIVYAGLGYKYGIVALTLYWTIVPACALTTLLFARRWRRAGVITPTEFLEQRFSPIIRQVFVWSGIPLKVIDESLKIVAIGVFVSATVRVNSPIAMTTVGLTILGYAVLGGLWAVVVTDLVQFILVIGAVLLLLPLTFHATGGLQSILARTPEHYFAPVHAPYGWLYVLSFLVLSTLSISGNWSLIQKFYAARSDKDAIRLGWFATIIFILLPPIWITTGMLARGYLGVAQDPQSVYAELSVALLPPGMLGLLVAALFAATMSVLSSGYNVMSAVLTLDVYRRILRPKAEHRELVFVGRALTALIALIVLAIALLVTYFRWTIFDTMVAAFGFFLPPTVIPMLAGLWSSKLSTTGVLAGFVTGITTGLGFLLYCLFTRYHQIVDLQPLAIILSTALTIGVLVVFHLFFPARAESARRALRFIEELRHSPRSVGQVSKSEMQLLTSPIRIAGIVIALMGATLIIIGLISLAEMHVNSMSLIMGGIFVLIGLAMIASQSHRDRFQHPTDREALLDSIN